MEGYPAQVARVLLFDLEAWDINCKQHIPLRFDEASLQSIVDKSIQQPVSLEAELAAFEGGVA